MPAASKPDEGQDWISADVQTRCRLAGDFDVQVDFRLLDWPSANGVDVHFAVADNRTMVRHNSGREEIVAWFPPRSSSVADDGLTGSFRLRRSGNLVHGYVLGEGGWFELHPFQVRRAYGVRASSGRREPGPIWAAAGPRVVRQLPASRADASSARER